MNCEESEAPFRFPPPIRSKLCQMLDSPGQPGQNDWRALSAGLRMEKFASYFAQRASPTDAVLTLWEAQRDDSAPEKSVTDLLNLLRVIGRQDCARVIEEEFGPWI